MFEKILLATDFSAHAELAKQVAVDLAKSAGKQLWALTVLEPLAEPLWAVQEPPGVPERTWKATLTAEEKILERDEAEKLARDVAEIQARGFAVTKMVREGDPAAEIVAAAREIGADLIVMGSHSNRSIWDVLLGSVTEKVVKHASCPVVVVSHTPAQSNGREGPFLLVTDFSDVADRATDLAVALSREQKTRLIILTVVGRGLGRRVAQLGLDHLVMSLRSEGIEAEGLLRNGKHGQIASEIVHVAQEVGASVIIMGSHSRMTVYDVLLGYVAEKVSKQAPCPVLIMSDRAAAG